LSPDSLNAVLTTNQEAVGRMDKKSLSESDISDKFIRPATRVAQLRHLCAHLHQRLTASQSTQAHLAEALVR
jgi:hypothetical protein